MSDKRAMSNLQFSAVRILTSGMPRYHHLDADTSLLSARDILPAPVAADLNGDGRVEVIAVTHTGHLQARLSICSCRGERRFIACPCKGLAH